MAAPVVPSPTNPPVDPPASSVVVDSAAQLRDQAIMTKLREQDELIKQQQAKLDELSKKPEVPIGDQNKEFWNNPVEALNRALKETVAPLIEFRNEFKATTAYEKIKNEAKSDARFKEFLAQPGVEQQMDQLMSKNPSPTHESFGATLMGLRGAMELGIVPRPVVTEPPKKDAPPTPPIDMTTIPPHMRPSSAPTPKPGETAPKLRELTENERRLARENKMTDAEYIEFSDDIKPLDVIDYRTTVERERAAKVKEGAK